MVFARFSAAPGLALMLDRNTGGLHHRLISDVPPGQVLLASGGPSGEWRYPPSADGGGVEEFAGGEGECASRLSGL